MQRRIYRKYTFSAEEVERAVHRYMKDVYDIPVPLDPKEMIVIPGTEPGTLSISWTEHAIIEDTL